MARYNQGNLYNSNISYNDGIVLDCKSDLSITANIIVSAAIDIITKTNIDSNTSVVCDGNIYIENQFNCEIYTSIKYDSKATLFSGTNLIVKGDIFDSIGKSNNYFAYYRKESVETIFKIEILDKYENVIKTIESDLIDGTVNYTLQNGQRRTANITLMNIDNKYTPNPKGLIWLNTRFRIWSGIKVEDKNEYVSNGIYILYEPTINSFFTETTATFNLNDKWSLLNGDLAGTLSSDYIIPVGSNIGDAVRSIMLLAQDKKSPIIIPTNITSPFTLTIDRGNNYSDMLLKLAEMISYDIYYDKDGVLRFQPPIEDKIRPALWDFSTNEVTYLGSTRRYEFNKLKNAVYIYGDNINGSQVFGSAKDTYIFSPTNVELIGERPLVINDEIIYNNDLAQQRANYELKKSLILQETIDVDCMPIYHLMENDIVTIEDSGNALNRERYLIQNINIPLNNSSTMKLNLWKVRDII